MGEELILKILDVNPFTSISCIGNIIIETGEWQTKEKVTEILIDFGNAIISQISIQQRTFLLTRLIYSQIYKFLIITLIGENCDDLYFDKVIWKKNADWNETCIIKIEPVSQEVFNQMMVEVLNYDQAVQKGLKRIKVYGIQDEQLYSGRKNNVKQLKKQSKNKHKGDSQERTDQKEKKQKIKIEESSNKKNNQWGVYNKAQNQNNNKDFVFIDPREKLRNVHKSPSPIKEEKLQFNQNTVQTPKQTETFVKHGSSINERHMIRYNLNQIDKQFLELHQELQKSSGIGKEMQLNFSNFEVYWLQ